MKKGMKKILSLCFVVSILTGCLAGCGSSTSGGAASVSASGGSATSGETITYTINSGLVEMRDDVIEKFVSEVKEKSNGRLQGQILEAGVMGSETESRQACVDGTINISFNNVFNYAPMDWQWLPGIVDNYDEVKELVFNRDGNIYQYCMKADEGTGLHMIGILDNGFRYMAAVNAPLNTASAVKGAKVRIPNFPTVLDFYNDISAIPTVIDHSEVASGLQQGMIDAADNAIYNYVSMGIQDMVHYITETGVWGFGLMSVNLDFWNSLSAEDQAIFEEEGSVCSDWYLQFYQDEVDKLVTQYTGTGAWEMCPPDDSLQALYKTAGEECWKQYVDSHPDQADWIAQLKEIVANK